MRSRWMPVVWSLSVLVCSAGVAAQPAAQPASKTKSPGLRAKLPLPIPGRVIDRWTAEAMSEAQAAIARTDPDTAPELQLLRMITRQPRRNWDARSLYVAFRQQAEAHRLLYRMELESLRAEQGCVERLEQAYQWLRAQRGGLLPPLLAPIVVDQRKRIRQRFAELRERFAAMHDKLDHQAARLSPRFRAYWAHLQPVAHGLPGLR